MITRVFEVSVDPDGADVYRQLDNQVATIVDVATTVNPKAQVTVQHGPSRYQARVTVKVAPEPSVRKLLGLARWAIDRLSRDANYIPSAEDEALLDQFQKYVG